MLDIIIIFAGILLLMIGISAIWDVSRGAVQNWLVKKYGNNNIVQPPVSQPPMPIYPPEEYPIIRDILRRCIDANYPSLGLCRPSAYPEQNSAPRGKWAFTQNGIVHYLYVFDRMPHQTCDSIPEYHHVNPKIIQSKLNQVLPSFCDEAGIPPLAVTIVKDIKNGRIIIGVRYI